MIEQEVESALEGKAWSPEAAALAVTLAERVKARAKGARVRPRADSRAGARASFTPRRPAPLAPRLLPLQSCRRRGTSCWRLSCSARTGCRPVRAALPAATRVPAAPAAVTAPPPAALGPPREQGVRVTSRCLWDTATDNYASVSFKNVSAKGLQEARRGAARASAFHSELALLPSRGTPPHRTPSSAR